MKINGRDVTPWANKKQRTVSYTKIEGPGSGLMKDGTKMVDLVAVKATVKQDINPLLVIHYRELLNLLKGDYVFVDYDDPMLGSRRAEMIPTLPDVQIKVVNGKEYATGMVLTLTER